MSSRATALTRPITATRGRSTTGRFRRLVLRTPLDLDADGRPDVRYPADKASISCVFNALADRVGPNDILYIFVSDHGGPTVDNQIRFPVPNVLICLCGQRDHDRRRIRGEARQGQGRGGRRHLRPVQFRRVRGEAGGPEPGAHVRIPVVGRVLR